MHQTSEGLTWFISTADELHDILISADAQLIEAYNLGLRLIVTSSELKGEAVVLDNRVYHLGLLAAQLHYPLIHMKYEAPQKISELRKQQEDKIDPGKRSLFRRFRAFSTKEPKFQLNQTHLPHFVGLEMSLCSACSLCTQTCPTGALALTISADQQAYSIDRSKCDGCALCEDLCSENAIQLGGRIESLQQKYQIVQRHCEHCGHSFQTNPHLQMTERLCSVCRQYKHIKGQLRIIES